MKKNRIIIVILAILLVIGVVTYAYYRFNPIIKIDTEVIKINENMQDKFDIKNSDKDNYRIINFTLYMYYSDNIEDIEIDIPYSFRELLGEDVYWNGSGSQFKDPANNRIEYKDEIIINYTQIDNKEVKDLLSKGTITILWKVNGKQKSKVFNIGESLTFTDRS